MSTKILRSYLSDTSLDTAVVLDAAIDKGAHHSLSTAVEQSLPAYRDRSHETIRRSDEAVLHEDRLLVPVNYLRRQRPLYFLYIDKTHISI